MSEYFNATFIGSIGNIANFLFGYLRSKSVALYLGPKGLGIYGQINQSFLFLSSLLTLSLGAGVVKLISQYKDDKEKIKRIASTFFIIQFITIVLYLLTLFFLQNKFLKYLLPFPKYYPYLKLILLSFPFYLLGFIFFSPFYTGFIKYGKRTKLYLIINFLITIFFITSIYFIKIKGIFFYFVFYSVISFSLSWSYSLKTLPLKNAFVFNPFQWKKIISSDILKLLFKFSFITMSLGFINNFIYLYLRGQLITKVSLAENGFFQVGYALSNYYLPLFTNGILFYFYPTFAKLSQQQEKERLFQEMFSQLFILIGLILLPIIIFAKYLILILYSSKFILAIKLIKIYVIIDITTLFAYLIDTSFLAEAKLKHYFIAQIFALITFFLFSFYYLPFLKANALVLGLGIGNLVKITYYLFIPLKNWKIFNKENLKQLFILISIIILIIMLTPQNIWGKILFLLSVEGIYYFFLSLEQKKQLKNFLFKFKTKFKLFFK